MENRLMLSSPPLPVVGGGGYRGVGLFGVGVVQGRVWRWCEGIVQRWTCCRELLLHCQGLHPHLLCTAGSAANQQPTWPPPPKRPIQCRRTLAHELLGQDVPGLEGEVGAHGGQEALPGEGQLRGGGQRHAADDGEQAEQHGRGGRLAQEHGRKEHREEGLQRLDGVRERHCHCAQADVRQRVSQSVHGRQWRDARHLPRAQGRFSTGEIHGMCTCACDAVEHPNRDMLHRQVPRIRRGARCTPGCRTPRRSSNITPIFILHSPCTNSFAAFPIHTISKFPPLSPPTPTHTRIPSRRWPRAFCAGQAPTWRRPPSRPPGTGRR